MKSTTQLWELRDCEILGMHTLRGAVLESRAVLDSSVDRHGQQCKTHSPLTLTPARQRRRQPHSRSPVIPVTD
jgi:hypothetical protein